MPYDAPTSPTPTNLWTQTFLVALAGLLPRRDYVEDSPRFPDELVEDAATIASAAVQLQTRHAAQWGWEADPSDSPSPQAAPPRPPQADDPYCRFYVATDGQAWVRDRHDAWVRVRGR